MAGIDPAVDAGGEHHAAALLQPDKPIPPGRIVWGQSFARNGDQAAAFGEPRQRRADMAQCRVRHPAFHMGCRRERRVHQHDGRAYRRIEMVVDVGGVIARDGNVLEQLAEQAGAGGGEFVKDQMTAGQFGEDGQQTCPGRGLQHEIRRRDRGGRAGHQAERERGGELLQRLALLGAAGVRRQQGRDLGQHGEQGGRGIGPRPHRRTELAQEQHLRGLASLVGGLPVPDAVGVGTAEARQHGGAQHLGIDGAAAFEIGQQQPGGGDEGRGSVKQRCCGRERGRGGE